MKSKEILNQEARDGINKILQKGGDESLLVVELLMKTIEIAESEIEERDKYITDCKGDIEMLIAENQSKDKEIADLKETIDSLLMGRNAINTNTCENSQLSEIQSLKEDVERLKGVIENGTCNNCGCFAKIDE